MPTRASHLHPRPTLLVTLGLLILVSAAARHAVALRLAGGTLGEFARRRARTARR